MLQLEFETYTNRFIPISFLLAFYVTSMICRWWDQFEMIGILTFNATLMDLKIRFFNAS